MELGFTIPVSSDSDSCLIVRNAQEPARRVDARAFLVVVWSRSRGGCSDFLTVAHADGTATQERDKLSGAGSVGRLRAAVRSCVPFARIGHRGKTRDFMRCRHTRALSGSAASGGMRMRTDSRVPRPGGAVPQMSHRVTVPTARSDTHESDGEGAFGGYSDGWVSSMGHRKSGIGHRGGRASGSGRGRVPSDGTPGRYRRAR